MTAALPFMPVARLTIQRGLPRQLIEIGQGLGNPKAIFRDESGTLVQRGLQKAAYARDAARENLVAPTSAADPSDAYVFDLASHDTPTGFAFDATFETAHQEGEGQANRLSGTLHGIGRDVVDRIPAGAAVKLECGYAGGVPSPLRQIFYGSLDYAVPKRSGGHLVWEFSATMNPDALLNAFIPVSCRREDHISYAVACRSLLGPLGVKVSLPDIFEKKGVGNWHAKSGAITEFRGLVQRLGHQLGQPDRFIEVPNSANFLELVVVDTTVSDAVEILELDLDSPVVTDVAPQRGSSQAAGATQPPRNVADVVDIYRNTQVEGMQVTMLLDPRVTLGMVVQWPPQERREQGVASEFGSGSFLIDSIRHDLGDWSTVIEGKLIGGDFLKPTATPAGG